MNQKKSKKRKVVSMFSSKNWVGGPEVHCYKFGSDHPSSLTFVEEMFSLMTSKTHPGNIDRIPDMKKTVKRNCFWILTVTKQAHLTVTKTLIPTRTLTLTEDMKATTAVGCASMRRIHI
jgi:hypothetical protein